MPASTPDHNESHADTPSSSGDKQHSPEHIQLAQQVMDKIRQAQESGTTLPSFFAVPRTKDETAKNEDSADSE
ncbi:hypothetical protein ACUY3K_10860 [Corynebacterium uberis]|uniref:hypothetical protein n=1 Tax=Corynebacterium TaxID=1716 RepID=UPI001D0BC016|nr:MULTISPECIES: hypothetical protein [Corynebacterium]MCZ9310042.1 hypothetical protein [Corynebacterium sp. c6VSa_13]UDL73790.1 hypothetical protein LH391_00710 [Corynebacterium uberis]UDL75327.1 hypothetical protein LH393_08700 [Corynebacterium uberis]UDL77538.1 hypothetical protein LH394_08680 [Corynebacterium uberis]UDL79825.1 hypothetical protein LH392_09115 [Corynebacterium uberis]